MNETTRKLTPAERRAIAKIDAGRWAQTVEANRGVQFRLEGRTWTLNGREHGSNTIGTHWLGASDQHGNDRDLALKTLPTKVASRVLLNSLAATRSSESYRATRDAALAIGGRR